MKLKQETSIYVCHTLFNLFISLVRLMLNKSTYSILYVPDNLKFIPKSFEGVYFNKLVVYPNILIKDEWNKFKSQQVHPFFNYKRALINLVEKFDSEDKFIPCIENANFYVYNDGVPFVTYLMLKFPSSHFTLIEEGELTYSRPKKGLRYWIKIMMGYPSPLGYSKYIDTIEVRFPERLSSNIRFKAQKMCVDSLMNELGINERTDLLSFFKFDTNFEVKSTSLILLTQPLSEDGIVSEEEKVALYKDMLEAYNGKYFLYIKPHPKEKTNYLDFIDDVIILAKDSPSELYHFMDFEFDIALTLFSTAIHSIPSQKHIFHGLDYAPKVKENWMKKMDVSKKY